MYLARFWYERAHISMAYPLGTSLSLLLMKFSRGFCTLAPLAFSVPSPESPREAYSHGCGTAEELQIVTLQIFPCNAPDRLLGLFQCDSLSASCQLPTLYLPVFVANYEYAAFLFCHSTWPHPRWLWLTFAVVCICRNNFWRFFARTLLRYSSVISFRILGGPLTG